MRRSIGVLFLASLLVALLPPAAPASQAERKPEPVLPTPALIERDVVRGELDRATADLYLAYSFGAPEKVPSRYESAVLVDGTLTLLQLRERVAAMARGPERAAIREALDPTANCGIVGGPDILDTTHFHIHYTNGTIGAGLSIAGYGTSLETAWATEINSLGWAAPPIAGSRYLVVVADVDPYYGWVSSTGTAGDNPNTLWNEGDAAYSCMALNADFSTFPPPAQAALDATTAHEFAHSIQYGYGALDPTDANYPDSVFIEGGATWMEDEVFDGSNDNYNYLWPTFTDDMGSYGSSPYSYWVVFRALTERFGTGTAGGGEQVMQDFWEETSKGTGNNLGALQTGLQSKGTNLADAYHAAAIALKFNRACAGGYVYPYCLEEGPAYVAHPGNGPTPVSGTISSVGGSFNGNVPDNYALNWVALPTSGGSYDVTLSNTSTIGGQLRGTLACDTDSALLLAPFPAVAGPSSTTTVTGYSPSGCSSVVAVITNQSQTADNPSSSTSRSYSLSTVAAADTVPPDTTITSGPSGTVNSTSATFEFTSSEPGSFACSFDGAGFSTCTSPTNYTGLAQGSHTFQVQATDGASNTDLTPASRTWTVDTVPPETTITSGPSGTVSSTSATLEFTSSEAGTFECRLDLGAWAGCTSPRNYAGLSDGPHTFEVRATDTAGNIDSSPASRTWTVETVPPETTITSGPSGTVNSSSATFSFVSSEPGSTFACSLDGAAFSPCSSPAAYSGLAVGSHTFRVRAADGAGNIDSSPAERTWTVAAQVHARQVSLSLKKHLQARGSVTASDGFASCLDGEAVQIQRRKRGNWSTVKAATTQANGSYRAKLPDKPGKYRALLAEAAASSQDICGAALSAARKHRHG